MLTAARSKIVEEKLTAEHAILAREVMLDPLTGLENRRAFDHWLASAPTQSRPTALLLIDLDAFKDVNDRHGHAVGTRRCAGWPRCWPTTCATATTRCGSAVTSSR